MASNNRWCINERQIWIMPFHFVNILQKMVWCLSSLGPNHNGQKWLSTLQGFWTSIVARIAIIDVILVKNPGETNFIGWANKWVDWFIQHGLPKKGKIFMAFIALKGHLQTVVTTAFVNIGRGNIVAFSWPWWKPVEWEKLCGLKNSNFAIISWPSATVGLDDCSNGFKVNK